MLLFFLFEIFNKIIGLVLIAVLARSLPVDIFSEYLIYISYFGYAVLFSNMATPYFNLIKYSKDSGYVLSNTYLLMSMVRIFLVLLSSFLLALKFADQVLVIWYLIPSLLLKPFDLEFVLYANKSKIGLVLVRFVAQVASLFGVLLVYFDVIGFERIFIHHSLQTVVLTVGTLYLASQYVKYSAILSSFFENKIKVSQCVDIVRDCFPKILVDGFSLYLITGIVLMVDLLGYSQEAGVFAQGLRICQILIPLTFFYLSFHIKELETIPELQFQMAVYFISLVLLLVSPLLTMLMFGREYLAHIFLYNFSLLLFSFDAIVRRDSLLVLREGSLASLPAFNAMFYVSSYLLLSVWLVFGEVDGLRLAILSTAIMVAYLAGLKYLSQKKVGFDVFGFGLFSLFFLCLNYYFLDLDYYDFVIDVVSVLLVRCCQ